MKNAKSKLVECPACGRTDVVYLCDQCDNALGVDFVRVETQNSGRDEG